MPSKRSLKWTTALSPDWGDEPFLSPEIVNSPHARLYLRVRPSDNYARKADPMNPHAQDDQRLPGPLTHAWVESDGGYGYRMLRLDIRDPGETCEKHRVARSPRPEGLRSQNACRRRPGVRGGRSAVVVPNHCSVSRHG